MTTYSAIAGGLYRSLAEGDRGDILARLHSDFTGHTTAGLPLGLGGDYHGPDAMLRDFWGRIARTFTVSAHPAEYLALGEDRLLVCGVYRGSCNRSGRLLEAEFVHLLRFSHDRIIELTQLTDSARWVDALDADTRDS
ncbi:nuclear transport factor 2 family protein [Rhodococcus opacus]|uniref:SnoaL-like domain-containing protein n=1 Tax=Rhodococcus opacus TaxID=37919 RepID=A0A076F0I3_RHOOP|nr:hypothetical protein [Rhodococcus opacus]AII10937.1 hypothetical protein EP51_43220 [Rhodococcus opacus]